MGPFKKYVHSEGGRGYFKSVQKGKRGEESSVFAQKKQCMYCNLYMQRGLNFEFGSYNVIKCIFILFNLNKVTQHVNYTCILFWNRVFPLPVWAKTVSSMSIHTPIIFLKQNSHIVTAYFCFLLLY